MCFSVRAVNTESHTSKKMAPDVKPAARTLILPSAVCVAKPLNTVSIQSNKTKCNNMYLYNVT